MDMSVSLRTFADEDRYAVTSHRNAPSGRPGGATGEVADFKDRHARSESIAEAPKANLEPYPQAFDRDTMRWMPLIVPLLGFFTAVLTGLMWMVVG